MGTKIALFGSEEMVNLVKGYETSVEEVEVSQFIYQTPKDMESLITKAANCDVYLFSGVLPYFYTKKFLGTFDKPAIYIADNELNVSLTLLSVLHHQIAELDRISFDLPDRRDLDIITKQLDINPKPVFITDYEWVKHDSPEDFQIDEILNIHTDLWKSGVIDLVITSIHAIHDQLVYSNIPCLRMIDAEKNIIDALKEAKNLGILQKTQHSQVAVGLLTLSTDDEGPIKVETEEFIFHELQSLAKTLNCTAQKVSNNSFVLYGTKGGIDYLLNHDHLLDAIYQYANERSTFISIGFGFGMTIVEAEKNSEIAISYSHKQSSANSIHIVTEDKLVINPQKTASTHSILKSEDEKLIQLAKELKISVTNLNKMIQFNGSRPKNSFTSSDICDYFEISKRSSERMLKKFFDCGYLQTIGEEQPYQNGRPRSIYRINLPPL